MTLYQIDWVKFERKYPMSCSLAAQCDDVIVPVTIDPCPGNDPTCPGHDHGDPCHYRGDSASPPIHTGSEMRDRREPVREDKT